MKITRRDTLVLGAAASALSLTGIGAAQAQSVDVAQLMSPEGLPDRVLGDPDAPVTVIEYASPTCPHCATFHNQVYPAFKERYVDTGQVQFILRPFVRNVLDAVVFMLAEAAGDEMYHEVIDTYFRTQNEWAMSDAPRDALQAIALQLGFTEESFEAALTNQDLFAGMEQMRDQALNDFNVTGTPTFYVNGTQLTGDQTLEELSAAIDPLLG
ncbi:DsbA family protein [Arsenicitalea aurantiaca]|uniref:DsbA family protein n=1 Tax=Arsenicitalea aurantiaca TaxID=1783274 RepID=A0A433XAQ5_9HYPH|nr:DsbA family protein [Arsenicitalea aurantiaca]RUT31156.1 DsbA family protein [Arsenicitalea aurantiaca]